MVADLPRIASELNDDRAEAWDARLDPAEVAELEQAALDAAAAGAEWILALDDWQRWPRIERFGSRSALLLLREL